MAAAVREGVERAREEIKKESLQSAKACIKGGIPKEQVIRCMKLLDEEIEQL